MSLRGRGRQLGNGARMACVLEVAHLRLKARGFGDDSPAAIRRCILRVVIVVVDACRVVM
eukprot:3466295-Prymnesium_polylepis.1